MPVTLTITITEESPEVIATRIEAAASDKATPFEKGFGRECLDGFSAWHKEMMLRKGMNRNKERLGEN